MNRSEELIRAGYESARRGQDGFEEALAEHGLAGRSYQCGDDAASGEACVERILSDDPDVTGIVTLNEAALGGLYRGSGAPGARSRATCRSPASWAAGGPRR